MSLQGKQLFERVKQLYDIVRTSRVVLYLNPDEEKRYQVLHKLCEVASVLGVKTVYVNMLRVVRNFVDEYDKAVETALQEIANTDAQILVLDNFELCIFVERFRGKFTEAIYTFLSTDSRRLVLGTTPEVLSDPRVSELCSSLRPSIVREDYRTTTETLSGTVSSIFRKFRVGRKKERDDSVILA